MNNNRISRQKNNFTIIIIIVVRSKEFQNWRLFDKESNELSNDYEADIQLFTARRPQLKREHLIQICRYMSVIVTSLFCNRKCRNWETSEVHFSITIGKWQREERVENWKRKPYSLYILCAHLAKYRYKKNTTESAIIARYGISERRGQYKQNLTITNQKKL